MWLGHCILWCGMKGIAPQQPLLLQPLKGVSDPPDRTAQAEPLLPHSGINLLSVRLSSRPMGRSPAVDRYLDWGFWLFFKGFIYK